MAVTKHKTVFSADLADLERAEALVREGRYRTLSDFVREAMADKLAQIEHAKLSEQVSRYCDAAEDDESAQIVSWQAFGASGSKAARREASPRRRAKR